MQTENGFFLKKEGKLITLLHHSDDQTMQLTRDENSYVYSDNKITISFNTTDFQMVDVLKFDAGLSGVTLKKAAEMKVLIDSVPGLFE
jgi:hypothetical protein